MLLITKSSNTFFGYEIINLKTTNSFISNYKDATEQKKKEYHGSPRRISTISCDLVFIFVKVPFFRATFYLFYGIAVPLSSSTVYLPTSNFSAFPLEKGRMYCWHSRVNTVSARFRFSKNGTSNSAKRIWWTHSCQLILYVIQIT